MVKQVLARSTFDNLSQIHHRHVVTHMAHHTQIMADEQIGQAKVFFQPCQQVQNLRLNSNIQSADRFIANLQFRVGAQGARDRNPLALTA